MTIPIFEFPPCPPGDTPQTLFRRELGDMDLAELGETPFVTAHGWHGVLHELQAVKRATRRIIAADFRVGAERALLYALVDSTSKDARQRAIDELQSAVPRFGNNLTLDQLLCRRGAALLPVSSRPRFDEMRRVWSAEGVAFELRSAAQLGRIEVKFAVSPCPAAAAQLAKAMVAAKGATEPLRYYGVTDDGEHFTLGFVRGSLAEKAVGAVYGDRHCIVVEAEYATDGQPVTFRDFLFGLMQRIPLRGCPSLRTRSVLHAMPHGWAVRTRDLTTHLFAPDGTTCMTVLPARPRAEGEAPLVPQNALRGCRHSS